MGEKPDRREDNNVTSNRWYWRKSVLCSWSVFDHWWSVPRCHEGTGREVTNSSRPEPAAILPMPDWAWRERTRRIVSERSEREVKDSSIDIVYRKLLEDLKQYCTEQEIEEECREYAEKKRAESTTTSGKRRGKAKR